MASLQPARQGRRGDGDCGRDQTGGGLEGGRGGGDCGDAGGGERLGGGRNVQRSSGGGLGKHRQGARGGEVCATDEGARTQGTKAIFMAKPGNKMFY